MKNSLICAFLAVSTLACSVTASFKIFSANQNFFNCHKTSLIENTWDYRNAQCFSATTQPGKNSEVILSLKPTNQPRVTNGSDRGKPRNPVPAGRSMKA